MSPEVDKLLDAVAKLALEVVTLKEDVERLKKDSHPSVDFIERISEAINEGKLGLTGHVAGINVFITKAELHE